jgi:hypothetical protein
MVPMAMIDKASIYIIKIFMRFKILSKKQSWKSVAIPPNLTVK